MKKLIYTFLAISIIFASCKKEEGCTDPIAINYNADAEKDDGSCTYTTGCIDASACNYDPNAVVDDGSCIFPDGCTDPTAFNFDLLATCDDGSCLYKCNDPFATNYNVPTTYLVCEYEGDVVFYLDVPAAVYFTNEIIPYLDVYVGNDLAGSMPTNAGFTSTVLCDDLDPEPVHFTYQWENVQSTTLPWTVRDGTGFIWYDGTDAIICNNCLSLQLTYKKIKEYQDSH